MNLIKEEWVKEDYQEFLVYLFSYQDEQYRLFHGKLLKNDNIVNIGVRTPVLKKIAKEISKGNYESFIKCIKHQYYEEDVIYGFILGYIKVCFEKRIELLDEFLPFIDNWATNDLVCSNLKVFKKVPEEGLQYIRTCLCSDNSWTVRFGLVLLLDFYINDNYIDTILDICKHLKHDDYYVLMALAWLISICYIKYPKKTLKLLKIGNLDDFTHNKAIQKIIESTRVEKIEKERLRGMKRCKNEE